MENHLQDTHHQTADGRFVFKSTLSQITEDFDQMRFSDQLLAGIFRHDFERPSQLQQLAIKPIITGTNDTIIQTCCNTGKTGLIAITALHKINMTINRTQVLILTPDGRSASQTVSEINHIDIDTHAYACINSIPTAADIETVRSGVHIVSGTSSAVLSLINNGHIDTRSIILCYIENSDQLMLPHIATTDQSQTTVGVGTHPTDMSSDTKLVLSAVVRANAQFVFMSPFISQQLYDVIQQYTCNETCIVNRPRSLTLEGIREFVIDIGIEQYKFETLVDLYQHFAIRQSVVYCNTNEKALEITNRLIEMEHSVVCIHNDLDLTDRKTCFRDFKTGRYRILITTDYFSSMIDFQSSVVINYDIPPSSRPHDYLSRIGRSGAYGRHGTALNFILEGDIRAIRFFESYFSTSMDPLPADPTLLW
eukprot:gnl/Dysnectes_brevis/6647_a10481_292.p1 GENE.gnl/Dysnectes_brevis/6647_a10481_292~~gnl/Dysnectes_brevis/6647_a10481_292.p1  ORF type:complete len:439 (+),score=-3.79 gnl/Dysnectes_brevis/6647_a10481_292:54-1319(+)